MTPKTATRSKAALSWLISPSHKLNDNILLYSSLASGQKSGSVQFLSNGAPNTVLPEKSLDFELGAKTLLLKKSLMLNVNLYQTTVKQYQQNTSYFDPIVTTQKADGQLYYTTRLGNIPAIRARGIEVDGVWSASQNLSVTFGAALNRAIYTDWKTATCPIEQNVPSSTTVCDNTGKQIIAAPKIIANIGVDYSKAVLANYDAHLWFSNVYRSSHNLTDTLSAYGVQSGYSLTDIGLGLAKKDNKFEIDLVGKNVFDKLYTTSITQYSQTNGVAYDGIGARRWFGIVLRTKI